MAWEKILAAVDIEAIVEAISDLEFDGTVTISTATGTLALKAGGTSNVDVTTEMDLNLICDAAGAAAATSAPRMVFKEVGSNSHWIFSKRGSAADQADDFLISYYDGSAWHQYFTFDQSEDTVRFRGHMTVADDFIVYGTVWAAAFRKLGDMQLLGDSTEEFVARRTISDFTETVTGSGRTIVLFGDHTHAGDKAYEVEIDKAGVAGTATFKWSDDGGGTWEEEDVVTALAEVFTLQNGIKIAFGSGTYDLGDNWIWTAIGTANQVKTMVVDTRNNNVEASELQTDVINERAGSGNGVTVDSVELKDGLVDGVDVAARDHAEVHDYDTHDGGVPYAELEYDDGTSDPLIDGVASDGVEASAARKDHVHPKHHTQVHGIADHTEHATWKALYTDAAGDEQEIALGADGTVFTSTGAAGVPAFEAAAGNGGSSTLIIEALFWGGQIPAGATSDDLQDAAFYIPVTGYEITACMWTVDTAVAADVEMQLYVEGGASATITATLAAGTNGGEWREVTGLSVAVNKGDKITQGRDNAVAATGGEMRCVLTLEPT